MEVISSAEGGPPFGNRPLGVIRELGGEAVAASAPFGPLKEYIEVPDCTLGRERVEALLRGAVVPFFS